MVTLEDVKKNPEVQELVIGAQKQLNALGYTAWVFLKNSHKHPTAESPPGNGTARPRLK